MLRITDFLPKKQGFKGKSEAGGAIIWIFLMIAIFAALNFAISRGTRTEASTISKERAALAATELINYAELLRRTTQTLQINGCDDTEISFENSVLAGYTNANAPPDESCHIYKPNGGALTFYNIPQEYISSAHGTAGVYYSGANAILNIGTGPLNAVSAMELGFYINGISDEICDAINKKINVSTKPNNLALFAPATSFIGTYTAGGEISAGEVGGKTIGCFYSTASAMNSNVFYATLIAR